mgnify:CR=1 FL=1
MEKEFKFEITKELGVLSSNTKSSKEVNLVSWNEAEPKLDIRVWMENHTKMGKGITLTKEEAIKLKEVLNKMDL